MRDFLKRCQTKTNRFFLETIITCFPLTCASWVQSSVKTTTLKQEPSSTIAPDDPLNILQYILRYLTKQSREPVESVRDLAELITNTCITLFDRDDLSQEFQFFEFFERSIATIVSKTVILRREGVI